MSGPHRSPGQGRWPSSGTPQVNGSREPQLNPTASGLLARALEFAVQAVFLAWDYPVAAPKVQKHFGSVIAAHVPAAIADIIRGVWEAAGQYSDLDLSAVIDGCNAVIDYMDALTRAPRPPGLPSARDLPSIGWDGLSHAEQDLLWSVCSGNASTAREKHTNTRSG